jgi:trk system potassium uptake protein TrkA
MTEEFAVIGLGRFGRAVAMSLKEMGKSVLVVDSDRQLVQAHADSVDAAVCADSTDEAALRELGIEKFSCVIVALGERALEASVMTTALMGQIGIPRIIARASTDLQARVLRAVGAHDVINPDAEMGKHLALKLSQPNIVDYFSFGQDAIVAEMDVPGMFVGKSLVELDLRNRYDVSVLAIRRGSGLIINPPSGEKFGEGERYILIGSTRAVQRVGSLI